MDKIIESSIKNFYTNKKKLNNDYENIPYYSKDTLKKLINDRSSFINFSIGKPALEKDIINLIELARNNTKINFDYYIITNEIEDNLSISNKLLLYKNKDFEILRELVDKKSLYLQQEYSFASFVIIFTCDLYKTIVQKGITYEQVLQETGTISQLIWLESIKKGLYGSVFAGTLQREIRNLSDIDYINKHQIFAIGLSRKGVNG
ncbi:hypothetical protein [Macrococcus equi]|uniref:hypothetical protein n=1 Tax=Macrococcus equi TaxID=3395462 RepID=UPI0039BE47CA